MEQKENQIDPAEEYKRISEEYCTRMRDYVNSVDARLKEVSEHMDMNDPYHADALRSFTWGLVNEEVEQEIGKIGRDYKNGVCSLRDIVVNE